MNDKPLYNSRITASYIDYLRKKRPAVDISKLLQDASISPYEVEDEGHWLTQKQVDDFNRALMAQTNDPTIPREAGRYMEFSPALTIIKQFIAGFITPANVYLKIKELAEYINRSSTFSVRKMGRNKVEIIVHLRDGMVERPYQCENRIGTFEAVAKFFSGSYPVIEHPECLHRGASQCRYIITWKEPSYIKWTSIRNWLTIIFVLTLAGSAFFITSWQLAALGASMTAVVLGFSFVILKLHNNDLSQKIDKNGNTANILLKQIGDNYNNALLVQQVTQAVSNVLDIDKLLPLIAEMLQKGLPFDRGMIMLANSERTRLVYSCGYGYEENVEGTLKNAYFHLDNPSSKGPFVRAFRTQTPILVNNIEDIVEEMSPRSRDFVASWGVNSFICVPIVFNGRSEGVLSVDNFHSKKELQQSQVNILMSIANQIAISLNNARIYHRLKESEERFRALSENSPDIIFTTDRNRSITYVNQTFREILGYSQEDILGKDLLGIAAEDTAVLLSGLFEELISIPNTARHYEGKLKTKDGKERLFNINMASNVELNTPGQILGVIGTLKDITEQRRLERQLNQASKMQALGGLAGGISHDFNNILQAITSYAEILRRRDELSGTDQKLIGNIQELAKRGKDLVNQLMIFSREAESNPTPLNLNDEIKRYHELLLGTFPKNIIIKLDLAAGLKKINADPAQIGQVIMNLAVNARDAMPSGGELTIETVNITSDEPIRSYLGDIDAGTYVMMRISDTGIGIEEKALEHIFEPFYTTKGVGKGTGIGLAVVHGIVKNHGGGIACHSKPGKGTTFEIYLPIFDGVGEDRNIEETIQTYPTKGHETILLVDDEPSLLETGESLLSFLGYNVLTASSGEEALEIVKKEGKEIDIVVMDLMMPGIGGLKALKGMRELFPELKAIIASGLMDAASSREIIKSGAAGFIKKPYLVEELNVKIREILGAPVQG